MFSIVIGSQGMLGKELVAILKTRNLESIYADINPGEGQLQLDIIDQKAVMSLIESHKPQVIFNCSAYTNVDLAEEQQELATAINGYGVENLALAAKAHNALLIHISTDYVFAGDTNVPYLPEDKTAPQGAYGKSKLLGEELIQKTAGKWQIIRTAWLFGPEGRNFIETILGLAKNRNSLKVVNDQRGCPTWAPDLARCMVDMAESQATGIFHFCNGPACTWYDLAKEAIRQAGINCNVEPCTSEEFPRPAKRPAWSVLDSSKTYETTGWQPQSWQAAVAEYIKIL